MRKIKKIKQMLMTDKGIYITTIQRKFNIGFVKANSILQKLAIKYNVEYNNHTYKITTPRTKILKEKVQK